MQATNKQNNFLFGDCCTIYYLLNTFLSALNCCNHLAKMPPKKKSPARTEVCCVCCQQIALGKDETLYCDGSCKQWLHRYCASVSKNQYTTITKSESPFQCPTCYREHSQQQIQELCGAVSDLKREIEQLKSALEAVSSPKQTPQPSSTPT